MATRDENFYTNIEDRHPLSLIFNQFRTIAFQKLTKKSTNLFLRGRDIISVMPSINGIHEPELTSLINKFSEAGYGDFLLDIGANIGLTSCQNGNNFEEVHMFEPNPLCCHILAVNTKIGLNKPNYEIHPFGLGSEEKSVKLTVPKHNWGGAFVNDGSNSYDEEILAGKDGFKSIDPINYFTIDIKIKNTTTELKALFEKLSKKNLNRGVIKIDVEGYEPEVLRGIAHALPKSCSVYIVFESWDNNFPIDEVKAEFGRDIKVGKITKTWPWKKEWPKLLKAFSLLFSKRISSKVSPIVKGEISGDIVFLVR
jgi:FkbM family methyltransferase